jgi:hypothetical protein
LASWHGDPVGSQLITWSGICWSSRRSLDSRCDSACVLPRRLFIGMPNNRPSFKETSHEHFDHSLRPSHHNHGHRQADQICNKGRQPIDLIVRIAIFDDRGNGPQRSLVKAENYRAECLQGFIFDGFVGPAICRLCGYSRKSPLRLLHGRSCLIGGRLRVLRPTPG